MLMAKADIRRSPPRWKRYVLALTLALSVCGTIGAWIALAPSVGQFVGWWLLGLLGIPVLLAPLGGVAAYYVAAVLVGGRTRRATRE